MKGFWIILTIVVAGLIGLFFVFNKSEPAPQSNLTSPTEVVPEDHIRGNPNAAVTIIEYGDFQCPACKATYPMLKTLEEEMASNVRIVFRHLPLASIHQHAFAAARAAEAAAAQGKFWEMHDLLYERQEQWSSQANAAAIFKTYAEELALDIAAYEEAVSAKATTDKINSAVSFAFEHQLTSTPTLYLNDQKLEPNPRSYGELKSKVEELIASPTTWLGGRRGQPALVARTLFF